MLDVVLALTDFVVAQAQDPSVWPSVGAGVGGPGTLLAYLAYTRWRDGDKQRAPEPDKEVLGILQKMAENQEQTVTHLRVIADHQERTMIALTNLATSSAVMTKQLDMVMVEMSKG